MRIKSIAIAAGLVAIFAASSAIAEKAPIKIGVLLPTTGIFAPNGQDALAGMQVYFDEIGWQVAGRKIELIVEDTQGKPDVGLTKARKLVEGDKVHMLAGVVSTGVALAINGYVRDKKIPLILNADAGANDLTIPGKFLNPYLIRVSQNGRMPAAAAADWGYKQGWRKVALIASDYAGGFDTVGGFADVFCLRGGQVTQEQYPPLGNPDYGPFLANLDRTVNAVVTFIPGADGLRFARQYIENGLNGKIPLMDIYGQASFEPNLPQLGDGALGIYSTLHYTPVLKTPENEKFVKAFMAKQKRIPADNGPDGWVGAHAIADAAKAVDGNVEDSEKFLAALKQIKFASPKGDIALDKYSNIVQNIYVRKVEKVDGNLVNTPIATYEKMDQFWPYSGDEFLTFKNRYPELKGKMSDCSKFKEKK